MVAASAGNHGQAVAWAARQAGIQARIFVPQDAPMAKVEACRTYGSELILERFGRDGRSTGRRGCARRDLHPSVRGSAGHRRPGTIGLELAEQWRNAETVVIPVGGGGLASGSRSPSVTWRPDLRIVGVQAGLGFTIADGVFVKKPGDLTMSILDDVLDDLVDIDDEAISEAIVLCSSARSSWSRARALSAASLLAGKVGGSSGRSRSSSRVEHRPVAADLGHAHGLTVGGRYLVVTRVPDGPASWSAPDADRRGAGERRVGRAPPRGMDLRSRRPRSS